MFTTSHFHPMIVHFPIALIMVGFLAELAFLFFKKETALSKAGFYLMMLGTLAALTAFTTGYFFTNEPKEGEIVKIFTQHETAAFITIVIMFIGSVLRIYLHAGTSEKRGLKWIIFGLYFLGAIAVSYTGLLGGTMVYSYMMSI